MNDGPDGLNWPAQSPEGNGLIPEDLAPVWDAVALAHPLIIEHITGPTHHASIGLKHCIRAFHAAAVILQAPVYSSLVKIFEPHPNGAFAQRIGTPLFADDVTTLWQECIDELRAEKAAEAKQAAEIASHLTMTDEPWDEDKLPTRPWLASPYLMRGQSTLLHGPGGHGKSQLAIGWAVALALGLPFGRLKPRRRCRVILTNFEDEKEEQERRISAALRYFNAAPADLKGWLFRVSLGPKGDATMFELDDNGQVQRNPCWVALERTCERVQPDAVVLDPFVAINAVPEQNNQLMRRVMTLMRLELAGQFNCALVIAHHDNKSGNDSEDADQSNARGAGDIVNAVRFELAVKKMTTKQAESWGIDAAQRGLYFRLGSAASKLNYAAPEESEWFERLPVEIGGEAVVRCIPWNPPSARLDEYQMAEVVEAVERGTEDGNPYSVQLSNTDRSLGPVLAGIGITKPAAQRLVLKNLIKAGRIVAAKWYPRKGGKAKTLAGLRSPNGLPSTVAWAEEEGEQ